MEKLVTVKSWETSKTGKSIKIQADEGVFNAKMDLNFHPVSGMKYTFTYDVMDYKGKPINWITEYVSQAGTTASPIPEKPVSADIKNQERHERIRSMAVSYAKDLLIEGIIGFSAIEKYADLFAGYIIDDPDQQPRNWELSEKDIPFGGKK